MPDGPVSRDRNDSRPRRDAPAEADARLGEAVCRARDGDEGAFRTLYRDMQPRVLRYLQALVGTDAEDVASETWLQVARDLRSFHGGADDFRGWVATLARHRAIDHLRRSRRQPLTAPLAESAAAAFAGPEDTAARALENVSTDTAIALIARLPRDQAEAVLLRVVVGLDATSAARVLGKRPGAVRTASYRGVRRLAAFLDRAGRAAGGEIAPGARAQPRVSAERQHRSPPALASDSGRHGK